MLTLLKHGIKDTIDYTLCSKAYVYKTLMAFYDCSLCDETTKVGFLWRIITPCSSRPFRCSWIFFMSFMRPANSRKSSYRWFLTMDFFSGYNGSFLTGSICLQLFVQPWSFSSASFSSSESVSIVATILENIATRLTKVDNQVLILEFDSVLTIFMRRLKNEAWVSHVVCPYHSILGLSFVLGICRPRWQTQSTRWCSNIKHPYNHWIQNGSVLLMFNRSSLTLLLLVKENKNKNKSCFPSSDQFSWITCHDDDRFVCLYRQCVTRRERGKQILCCKLFLSFHSIEDGLDRHEKINMVIEIAFRWIGRLDWVIDEGFGWLWMNAFIRSRWIMS